MITRDRERFLSLFQSIDTFMNLISYAIDCKMWNEANKNVVRDKNQKPKWGRLRLSSHVLIVIDNYIPYQGLWAEMSWPLHTLTNGILG